MSHRIGCCLLLAWIAVATLTLAVSAQPPASGPSVIAPADNASQTEAQPDPRESQPAPSSAASSDPASRPAAAQSTQPASQATSRPAEAEIPLRSPRAMMAEFLQAVSESEDRPERIQDAVRCLDLSILMRDNLQAVERRGPVLARQLDEIVEALLNTYGKTRWEIPREPKGDRVVFPAKGEVQLVMTRSDDGVWRFSADTVAAVPKLLETIRQKKEAKERESPEAEVPADVPPGLRSARATMRTFIDAMGKGEKDQAARCLDLSDVSPATAAETGAKLADQLRFVMDRIGVVVYQDIPPKAGAEPFAWYIGERGRIELARQESGPRKGQWLFTKATIKSIETLFKAYQDKPRVAAVKAPSFWNNPRLWLLETMPSRLKTELLGVQAWQWLGILILLILAYLVHRLALLAFGGVARMIARSGGVEFREAAVRHSLQPVAGLVMVATWWGGLQLLLIPIQVLEYVWPALKFVLTAAGVWASYRLIDLVSRFFALRATRTQTRLDDVLVPLARKTAKIIVVAVGLVFVLKALGAEQGTIEKLFAGLGIGGLAFALAAQESLKNFFGSVAVVLDRPFQVGDWVRIGDVEGTIESVGLRSSRIRTFYDSEVTVPNADLTTATIDNMGRRRYRRTRCNLSLTYSTPPDRIEAFCEGVRELIRRQPHTRKDNYDVWVGEFAASSIDVVLNCFHDIPEGVNEPQERHRLFMDILNLAARLGVEFAFPTRTIHLSPSGQAQQPASPAPGSGGAGQSEAEAAERGRQLAAEIIADSLRKRQTDTSSAEPQQAE
jgi:MscS family membrane protein